MSGFNFNQISLSEQADISKIQENFEEIENNGITYAEVKGNDNNFRKRASFTKVIDGSGIGGFADLRIDRVGELVYARILYKIPKIFGKIMTSYDCQVLSSSDFADWFIPSEINIYSPGTIDKDNVGNAYAYIIYDSEDTTNQKLEVSANFPEIPAEESTTDSYYFTILFMYKAKDIAELNN